MIMKDNKPNLIFFVLGFILFGFALNSVILEKKWQSCLCQDHNVQDYNSAYEEDSCCDRSCPCLCFTAMPVALLSSVYNYKKYILPKENFFIKNNLYAKEIAVRLFRPPIC